MKVCDCVKNSIWYDPRVRKQIAEYVRNGVEVVGVGCICPRYSKDEVDKIECPVFLAEIPQKLYNRGASVFKKAYREIKTDILMYKLIKNSKADIIHANDLNALIPAFFAARRTKAKLIYDSHEIFIENPWVARVKWLHFFLFHIEKLLLKRISLLVNVSHAAGDYMSKIYSINDRVVVTNCISEKTLSKLVLHKKHEGFEVLNHGQFYEGRGYDIMIKTAPLLADVPEVKMVLRGFGPMEKSLKGVVDRENYGNVVFEPPVKTQDLISYAHSSHVGIAITQPISINYKLSISNKLFEYAAAGLPVIMSNIPEHKYLNDKYKFGIILENDTPECLASAIKVLYNDRLMYSEMASNAKRLSSEVTWELEFQKLLDKEYTLIS